MASDVLQETMSHPQQKFSNIQTGQDLNGLPFSSKPHHIYNRHEAMFRIMLEGFL
jgi:hypothetical protein